MEKYIKLSEALDILKVMPTDLQYEYISELDGFYMDEEVEPKQGEWICHKGGWIDFDYYPTKYECNQCHHYVDVASDKKFCPNCGAKMKGADDE